MANVEKNKTGLVFEPFRLTDRSVMDVPFRIRGHKLRWISAAVQSVNNHRGWKQLRREDIPPEMLKELQREHFGLFTHDGDTIRYGDTVLAFMSFENFDKLQASKNKAANDQMSQVMTPSNRNVKVDKGETSFENKVTREFFDQ